MTVTLQILRQNPETGNKPDYQDYTVDVQQTDRVLDALMDITRTVDGSLGFRRSCAHGVCGSDAMRINGKERLACKTLFQDVVSDNETVVKIEPLRHLPVQKDLMVDQNQFFAKFRSVKPYIIPKEDIVEKEFIQSQEDRALFDEATKCINCAACYSACPILDENPNFLGPAAIVQAARFVRDSRDKGLEARLDELDRPDGIWPCQNKFECTRVCPRDIKITKLINLTKREITKYRESRGETVNDGQNA
ncbi:MAG: succinate dehydrogenase/fumarate reductase iron-sulfur subunit [Spirochaetota bacterium]